MFTLQCPQPHYWENFSYRFKGLEKNSQYLEREDEFDSTPEKEQTRPPLTADEFDHFKTHHADFIFPEQSKLLKHAMIKPIDPDN